MIIRVFALIAFALPAQALEVVFPKDGWYQLQDRETYVEVCNSNTPCDVPAGIYQLINHTTGEVNNNYIVSGSDIESSIEFTRSTRACNIMPVAQCIDSCPGGTNLLLANCEAYDVTNRSLALPSEVTIQHERQATCETTEGSEANFSMVLLCVNAPVNEISFTEEHSVGD